MGGGLEKIQRAYKSPPRELPPIRNIGYIHKVTRSKHHAYTYNYYFNLESPID